MVLNIFTRNIIRFIVLVLLQVLLLDNILLLDSVTPFFYVLFILLLPFEVPAWLIISLGFLLGLGVDMFGNTIGLHTSATVLMAYMRGSVLKMIAPRDGYEPGTFPRMHYYGFVWFFKYALILILAHHLCFFILDVFGFRHFLQTLADTLLTTAFTLAMVVLSQFFIYRK